MHDSVRDNQAAGQPGTPPTEPKPIGLFDDIGQLGRAVRQLFGAQAQLLAAELGLARSAVSWIFVAGLAATITGVGLGLTLLGLFGLLLAKWLGSWILAFGVLAVLQALALLSAILLFRRCMHWMSLPGTRHEWHAIMRDTMHRAKQHVGAGRAEADRGEP